MAHSDNNGLVLPPKLAPIQVVIVPIYKGTDQIPGISEVANRIKKELESKGISVKYDDRDTYKPGWKFAEYELKGVPVRLALGPRDIENNTIELARRDTLEKQIVSQENIGTVISELLDDIQKNIYNRALKYRDENIRKADNWDEFNSILETSGGFISAFWDGTVETEEKIKDETKATIRCIPLDAEEEDGKCVFSGKPAKKRVLFARSY
jgi:prolyl-tRNA synthetase